MQGFLRPTACAALVAACAIPEIGNAQEITETESYGERYDYIETFEYGEGTTAYIASTRFEINGADVLLPLPELFSYERAFTAQEVAAQLPENYVHMVDGVGVTITGWASPELTDSYYEVTDTFFFQSYNSYVANESSVQLTSGDFSGAEVPIGYRGWCSDGGTSGSTNFDAFDGHFASCESAEDVIAVAPGTVNRNTHNTTVYVDEVYTFESSDYAVMDYYLVRPASSSSWSSGTLDRSVALSQTVRENAYSTGLKGMFGGETVFDVSTEGALSDEAAQALLTDLSRPAGRGANGAAAIFTWSAPQLVSNSETLLSTTTSVEVSNSEYTIVTVTMLQGSGAGETVLIGDRGSCTSTGVSGQVTSAGAGGEMALCDTGVEYLLSLGEVNTNTHKTAVREQTVSTTTTESWQVRNDYILMADATLIGQIHSAAIDAVLVDGRVFAALHRDAAFGAQGTGPSFWARVARQDERRQNRDGRAGFRQTRDIAAGGIGIGLAEAASIGIGIARSGGSTHLGDSGESAEIEQTSLGIAATAQLAGFDVSVTVEKSWADLATSRDNAGLGSAASSAYEADTIAASLRLGSAFEAGPLAIGPFAEFTWQQTEIGTFVETGSFALSGQEQTFDRYEVQMGARLESEIETPGETSLVLGVELSGGKVFGVRERERLVSFADNPTDILTVSAAAEPGIFAQAGARADLTLADGLGFHLGASGRTAAASESWRVQGGLSFDF